MANDENLIPFEERTESEQREIRSKGGIASGKSRRHKRDLQKTAAWLLSLPLHDGALDTLTSLSAVNGRNMAVDEAMLLSLIQKVLNDGDTAAAKLIFSLCADNKDRHAQNNGDKKAQNNILQALFENSAEDMDTDDLQEIRKTPKPDNDVVEPPTVP